MTGVQTCALPISTYDAAGVPRDVFESVCAIAVGTRGTDDDLHPRMVKQNMANDRKPVGEIAFKGRFSERVPLVR